MLSVCIASVFRLYYLTVLQSPTAEKEEDLLGMYRSSFEERDILLSFAHQHQTMASVKSYFGPPSSLLWVSLAHAFPRSAISSDSVHCSQSCAVLGACLISTPDRVPRAGTVNQRRGLWTTNITLRQRWYHIWKMQGAVTMFHSKV